MTMHTRRSGEGTSIMAKKLRRGRRSRATSSPHRCQTATNDESRATVRRPGETFCRAVAKVTESIAVEAISRICRVDAQNTRKAGLFAQYGFVSVLGVECVREKRTIPVTRQTDAHWYACRGHCGGRPPRRFTQDRDVIP